MTGIVGTTWFMRDNLTDVGWTARTPLRDNTVAGHDTPVTRSWEARVLEALSEDVRVPPASPGVYGFGKEVARTARLALIADELGEAPRVDPSASWSSLLESPAGTARRPWRPWQGGDEGARELGQRWARERVDLVLSRADALRPSLGVPRDHTRLARGCVAAGVEFVSRSS